MKMRITYQHAFTSVCPVNGERIAYHLAISAGEAIQVERIVAACAQHKTALHEDIAADLARKFPGTRQTLTAHHHGVDIETVCE